MSLKDYKIVKELGKGAFGTVVMVRKNSSSDTIYAMKRVKMHTMSVRDQENALNEIRILASVNHPNVVGYEEAFYDKESQTLNTIMEYANKGDLTSRIKEMKDKGLLFPENEIWSILIGVIQGLKALHDKKIMHRDLKCANIFMSGDNTVKLGDMNVSKELKNGMLYTQTGTPYYASPEVWAEKPYDMKSDIWSVGCIIYELCCLKQPFRAQSIDQLFKCVTTGTYEAIPNVYSKELSHIISQLLQVNPIKRPSCDALLRSTVISKRQDVSKIAYCRGTLMSAIKLPINLSDVNSKLPKTNKNSLFKPSSDNIQSKVEVRGLSIDKVSPIKDKENNVRNIIVKRPCSARKLLIDQLHIKMPSDRDHSQKENIALRQNRGVIIQPVQCDKKLLPLVMINPSIQRKCAPLSTLKVPETGNKTSILDSYLANNPSKFKIPSGRQKFN